MKSTENYLRDEEWVELVAFISAVERSDNPDTLRFETLDLCRTLVDLDMGIFFLLDSEKSRFQSYMTVQAVGVDVPAADFVSWMESLPVFNQKLFMSGYEDLFFERTAQSVPVAPAGGFGQLGGNQLLMCLFVEDERPLAALCLCRDGRRGAFGDREQFVLEVANPYVSARLDAILRGREPAALREERLAQQYSLTAREVEVARCISFGMSNPEISERLCVSISTVKKHLEHIYRKMGVNNRLSLMKFAQQILDGRERP